MNETDQIECGPYRCSLGARACAKRYAEAQVPAAAYRSRDHLAHCRQCIDGRERWQAFGSVPAKGGRGFVTLKRVTESARSVYIPRVGVP